jgi:serine/threonine protein kinase
MSEHFNQLAIALQERYQLKAELGRGGMATVYLAQDLHHGRRVAIKVLHPELAGAVGHDRFLREIRIASDLSHPHILPLLDSGSAVSGNSTLPFYVMPFVEGESLRVKLQREGLLPIEEAMKIAHDVATALGYAHARGVVHRDIKPENILLTGDEAVVADFGIARAIDRAAEGEVITSAGLAVGTPAYMSPEQGAGHHEVDGRSDIYSLGCVLYEMLGGDPPFSGPSPNAIAARHRVDTVPPLRTIRPSVPPSLEAVVLRSLEKVPADRFKTAEQFAAAIGHQHTPSASIPPGHPNGLPARPWSAPTRETPVPRWPWPRRTLRMGIGALLMTAVVLIGWRVISRANQTRNAPRYADAPSWSAWRGWDGEFFPVFAVGDSMLVIRALFGDGAQVFDGRRWVALTVPDSFELLRYVGSIPDGRLLAAKRVAGPSGLPYLQYWWMVVSPHGIQAQQPVGESLPDRGLRPAWWSDGREVILWLDAIRRVDGATWTREATGAKGGVAQVWGNDFNHRFAIPSSRDSVLLFDGISWSAVSLLPSSGDVSPVYQTGASFPDGSTVVVGEECIDDERCRPFLLQQDTVSGPWVRVTIPGMLGIPVNFSDSTSQCESSHLTLTGVAGRSRESYFIWGAWSTCMAGLEDSEDIVGCPPGQPCFWQVSDGKLTPVEGLLGKLVQVAGYAGGSAYALLDDGTLSRQINEEWRPITQVPGLALRLVGASPRMVLRFTGGTLDYEPGHADRESPFSIVPMRGLPIGLQSGMGPHRLVVRDTLAALLTREGSVYFSICGMERAAGTPKGALGCSQWNELPSTRRDIRDIGILPDGSIVGVGARGLVIVWHAGVAQIESLPREAREDSFWGVAISAEGRAVAIGSSMVTERDSIGHWSVIRRIRTRETPNAHFLALSNGDLVLGQNMVEIWDRTSDSIAIAVLYQRSPGGSRIGALHALPDGRLILGLSNPEDPLVGGSLLVWAAPARANQSQTVQLPINLDITDLTDDGKLLHVVGRGGSLRIPLDSLPFSRRPGN